MESVCLTEFWWSGIAAICTKDEQRKDSQTGLKGGGRKDRSLIVVRSWLSGGGGPPSCTYFFILCFFFAFVLFCSNCSFSHRLAMLSGTTPPPHKPKATHSQLSQNSHSLSHHASAWHREVATNIF